jgi:uncharacterized protein (DUF1330 family)
MSDVGFIIVLARIHDRAQFAHYVKALPPVYQQFEGQYLCLSPAAVEVLGANAQAGRPQALVISRFASIERTQEFWWSQAYQDVAKLRAGTGEFSVATISGVMPSKDLRHIAVLLDAQAIMQMAQVCADGTPIQLEGELMATRLQICAFDGSTFALRSGRAFCGARVDALGADD